MTEDQIRNDERLCAIIDALSDQIETQAIYLHPFSQDKLRKAVMLIEDARLNIQAANLIVDKV